MLPGRISAYLFEPTGQLRTGPFDVAPLRALIARYCSDLAAHMQSVIQDGWPAMDQEVTTAEVLAQHVNRMADELDAVLTRLRKRLQWASREIQRLNKVRHQEGTLDEEDEAHFRRCDRLIKKLKGVHYRRRQVLTSYDPPGTSEGTLDPLGLYQIADQLAMQLVPAVRERMQRIRFLTALYRPPKARRQPVRAFF